MSAIENRFVEQAEVIAVAVEMDEADKFKYPISQKPSYDLRVL